MTACVNMMEYLNNLNYQKMISGQEYNCLDPVLLNLRAQQQRLNRNSNQSGWISADLLPNRATSAVVETPVFVTYGLHVYLAENVFINFNVTLLDNAPISIGRQTMVGPNVQFYTSCHPLAPELRCQGLETAKAITVGEQVWIGGGAILMPGITVGDGAVIGAGAVVTKDVPARTVVAGNPAKIIREI